MAPVAAGSHLDTMPYKQRQASRILRVLCLDLVLPLDVLSDLNFLINLANVSHSFYDLQLNISQLIGTNVF